MSVQPEVGSIIEGYADVVGVQETLPVEICAVEGFADAPERLAQVAARVGFGRFRL